MGNPKKIFITAAVLFFIDAFVLNQGGISAILILLIIFWWLPKALFKKRKGLNSKPELAKALIFGLAAGAVFLANFANNKIAQNRADRLVDAIESYHRTTGQYPRQLSDLVPAHIPQVPKAKYSFAANDFVYLNHEGTVSLFYTIAPPFGRMTYNFNGKSWIYVD
jgi:hypothetical protein